MEKNGKKMLYRILLFLLLLLLSCNGTGQPTVNYNPGSAPPDTSGHAATWSTSMKSGIGTSYEAYTDGVYKDTGETGKVSRVWFSIAQGIVTETAFGRIDKAQIRDLQFLVTGPDFFHEERKNTTSTVEYLYTDSAGRPLSLAYKVTTVPENNQYKIEKYIYTDPDRQVLFLHINFTANAAGITPYLLINPYMNNTSSGDYARAAANRLVAGEGNTVLAVKAQPAFKKTSAGFVAKSDGWQDLNDNHIMDWEYGRAEQPGGGDVALMGMWPEMNNATVSFDVAVGFGSTENAAWTAAGGSLAEGWQQVLDKYNGKGSYIGWSDYLAGLSDLERMADFTGDGGKELYASAMVLKAQEDKTYAGALIASLSIPWGDTVNAEVSKTGYRAVWPRDFYQASSALLALGDRKTPLVCFKYLKTVQVTAGTPGNTGATGWFLQKTEVNGTLEWIRVQMDQTAMPIMLGWKLWKNGVLSGTEITAWYQDMLKPAALFLANGGHVVLTAGPDYKVDVNINPPWTDLERWEEQSGYSPSTIAAIIAGLVCAADIAIQAGETAEAEAFAAKADIIEANLEHYMFTTTGTWGDSKYYLRITPDPDPNDNSLLSDGNGVMHNENEKNILDAGFLELVRYGVCRALDPAIVDALEEIDDTSLPDKYRVRYDLAAGGGVYPGFRRYGEDGYGELTTDGSNFRDDSPDKSSRRGRVWPFFTGERGHYELERRKETAGGTLSPADVQGLRDIYVKGMETFANAGLMLPEQVWDGIGANSSQFHFITGEGTNSATPLAWTHAEYIKLVRSLADQNTWDSYSNVRSRYQPLSSYAKKFQRVFFRGTPNNWESAAMQLIGNNTWQIEINFSAAADMGFKFDVFGDWSLNFGDNDHNGYADQNGANIPVTGGAGLYRIAFNDLTKQYQVLKLPS